MHSFIKNYLHCIKNCIGPTDKKPKPRKSALIKNQVLKLIETPVLGIKEKPTFVPAPGIPTSPLASRDPKLLLAAEHTPFEGQTVPTQVSSDTPRFPGP